MKRFTTLWACTFAVLAGAGVRPCRADVFEQSALLGTVLIKDDPTPGMYDYQFQLIEKNLTGDWQPGQGYGGIVFGDVLHGPSGIADFSLVSVNPSTPWNTLNLATFDGFHNGPIFAPFVDQDLNPIFWYPTAIGDTLSWTGTSANRDLSLTFSTIFTDGATAANFQPFVYLPEPSPMVLALVVGVVALGGAALSRWRRGCRLAGGVRRRVVI